MLLEVFRLCGDSVVTPLPVGMGRRCSCYCRVAGNWGAWGWCCLCTPGFCSLWVGLGGTGGCVLV